MRIIQIVALSLALLWMLLQRINVKIFLSDASIRLNLPILSITFNVNDNGKAVIKKNFRLIKNLSPLAKSLGFILKRSYVEVNLAKDILAPTPLLRSLPLLISYPVIYAYLNNTAKSVDYLSPLGEDSKQDFDLSVHFTLVYLFILPFLFLYYKVKNKLGRLVRNV